LSFDAFVSAPGGDEIIFDATICVNRADVGLTWNRMGKGRMHRILLDRARRVRSAVNG
jgi:hypothetical protein